MGRIFFDINHGNIVLDLSSKEKWVKMKKWDLIKFKRFFITKKTINKNKKITYGMVKTIGKQWDQEGINFQNIQIAFCIQNIQI